MTTVNAKTQQDCYFYYYSTCAKGILCPFRHESAALKNETMCKYWLQGMCNKPTCMFRHMQISVNRSNIACYYEKQPLGCKKVHCPFMHENVLNHPKAEDAEKQPDIILPLKPEAGEDFENKLRQVLLSAKNPERIVISPSIPIPAPKSCIVSLHDDDSDAEGSPMKKSPQVPSHHLEEIKKIADVIRAESTIIGYNHRDAPPVIYGNINGCVNDESDTVHRRIQMTDKGITITKSQPLVYSPETLRQQSVPQQNQPEISVSVKATVSVNGRLRTNQREVHVGKARLPIKSRLGKYTKVDETTSNRKPPQNVIKKSVAAAQRSDVRQRLSSKKNKTRVRYNPELAAGNDGRSQLYSKNFRESEKFNSTEISFGQAKPVTNLGELKIRTLKEIRSAKTQRPRTVNCSRQKQCKSTNSHTDKPKHKPIIFDDCNSYKIVTKNTFTVKSPTYEPVVTTSLHQVYPKSGVDKDHAKRQRMSTDRSFSQLSDSLLEEELLMGVSTCDFDGDELDEDILLTH